MPAWVPGTTCCPKSCGCPESRGEAAGIPACVGGIAACMACSACVTTEVSWSCPPTWRGIVITAAVLPSQKHRILRSQHTLL